MANNIFEQNTEDLQNNLAYKRKCKDKVNVLTIM